MRRLAVIDLGSNTARLVVFAYEPQRQYRQLDELREVVRLSQGMGDDRILRADAFERGVVALETFRAYCDAAGIDTVRASATSAVRDAANRESFLLAVRQRTGIELDILDGQEEARCGVRAVAASLPLDDALVLDLGGGSAQLSLMMKRRFVRGASWPLGAVRSSERFLRADPPKKKEVKALLRYAREQLTPFVDELPSGLPLVGMGGTVRNLAAAWQKRSRYPLDMLHGYFFAREALEQLVEELLAAPLAQRREFPGLSRDRADIIVAGGLVIREVVKLLGADGITISGQGIREGLFYPYLFPEGDHLPPDVRDFSVVNLMRQYYDHEAHNQQVRKLSLMLFDQLEPLHGYGAAERELLAAAALLHDIGMAVNYFDHHKHGLYLALSRPLPGFTHREQALVALLIRYHRKGRPGEQGLGGLLRPDDMERVARLGGMLRLAEYLERSKAQRIHALRCHLASGYLQVEAHAVGDARVEVNEANLHSDLLAQAFGLTVEVIERRGSA